MKPHDFHKKSRILTAVRSLIIFLLILTIPAGAWYYSSLIAPMEVGAGVQNSYFESGDGTEAAPFEIKYPLQLYYFAWLQNMGVFNKLPEGQTHVPPTFFYLSADLDMTGITLPPIGNRDYPFVGRFFGKDKEGNIHTIKNLTVKNQAQKNEPPLEGDLTDIPMNGQTNPQIVGFFGVVGNYKGAAATGARVALVQDFNLDNITVRTDAPADNQSLIGIVAGYCNAAITNVGVISPQIVIAPGIQPLASASTENYSDTTLVGYCEPGFRDTLEIATVKVGVPTAKAYSFLDRGPGKNWGDSIPMKDIYHRLSTVFTESKNPASSMNGYANRFASLKSSIYELTFYYEGIEDAEHLLQNAFEGYHYTEIPSPFPSFCLKKPGLNLNSEIKSYGPNVPVRGLGPNAWGVHPESTAGSYCFSQSDHNASNRDFMYLSGENISAQKSPHIWAEKRPGYDAFYFGHTAEDGKTYFLALNEQKNGVYTTTDPKKANPWLFTNSSDGYDVYYMTPSGEKYYLTASPYLEIHTQGGYATKWNWKEVNQDGSYTMHCEYEGIQLRLVWNPATKGWETSCDKLAQDQAPKVAGVHLFHVNGNKNHWLVPYKDKSGNVQYTTNENYNIMPDVLTPAYPWVFSHPDPTNPSKMVDVPAMGFAAWSTRFDDLKMAAYVDGKKYYLKKDMTFTTDSTQAAIWVAKGSPSTDHKPGESYSKVPFTFSLSGVNPKQYLTFGANQKIELAQADEDTTGVLMFLGEYPMAVSFPDTAIAPTPIPVGHNDALGTNMKIKLPYYQKYDKDPVDSAATNPTYFPLTILDQNNPLGKNGRNLNASPANTGYIVSGINFHSQTFPYQSGDIRVSRYPAAASLSASLQSCSGNSYNGSQVSILGRSWKHPDKYSVITPAGKTGSTSIQALSPNNASNSVTYQNQDAASMGFSKFDSSKETLDKLLTGEANAYGLHFMNSHIGMDNTLIAPGVQMQGLERSGSPNNGHFKNLELPQDCIDFTLQDKGFINFFAGSYFENNNSFFSLHHIIRDAPNQMLTTAKKTVRLYDRFAMPAVTGVPPKGGKTPSWAGPVPTEQKPWDKDHYPKGTPVNMEIDYYPIKAIKEISKIYRHPTDDSLPYYYEYTDSGTYGTKTAEYVLAFDTAWLTAPAITQKGKTISDKDMIMNALYYFEIPVNKGEYALGSVSSKAGSRNGAYLLYLDISASAAVIHRAETTELFQTVTNSYEYPRGITLDTAAGTHDSVALASLPRPGIEYTFFRENGSAYIKRENVSTPIYLGDEKVLHTPDGSWAMEPNAFSTETRKIITQQDFNNSDKKTTTRVATLVWGNSGALDAGKSSYVVTDPEGKVSTQPLPPEISTAFPGAVTPIASYHYSYDSIINKDASVAPSFQTSSQTNSLDVEALADRFPEVSTPPKPNDITDLLTSYTISVTSSQENIQLYMEKLALPSTLKTLTINGKTFQEKAKVPIPKTP